jgi:hypothetical protein
MGVDGQRHAPAALPPVMTRYQLYRRLGRPQGRSGRLLKISPPTGIRSPDRPARSESHSFNQNGARITLKYESFRFTQVSVQHTTPVVTTETDTRSIQFY